LTSGAKVDPSMQSAENYTKEYMNVSLIERRFKVASLYEIDKSIMECIDLDTGEVIDPERLDSLQMERNQKIENVVLWVKNLQSDALAFKAEKEAFAEREKAANAKIESLKKWLGKALAGEKFSTGKCAVSFRKSEQVEILDADIIPDELRIQTVTFKPDKTAIKELIKSGMTVDGCRLVENLNTQIK
jgi:hypothetical protein